MKKIDTKKIEQIKQQHFEYCRKLRPQSGRAIKEDLCWKLCCEDPFDFENHEASDLKFLKQKYWKYVGTNDISYKNQYKGFRTATENNKDWNGVELLRHLNIDVCPYCGLNYISSIEKTKAVATFDHYFSKEKYPFLAMNIYNLVPVCRNCNSIFKYNDDRKIINPFFDSVEENITFRIKNFSLIEQILFLEKEPEIEVLYDPTDEKVDNHCKVLALQERYNNFKNIVKTLVYKKHKYNQNYIKELKLMFDSFLNYDLERDLIKQDIYSSDETFSKFKSDIWEQLNLHSNSNV